MEGEAPTCRVVGPGEEYVGRQGTSIVPGVSAQTVGAGGPSGRRAG